MTNRRPVQTGLLSFSIDGKQVPVTIVRSNRRRRTVSFSVADGGVLVRSPQGTSVAFIRTALELRSDWLSRQLVAQEDRPEIEDGSSIPWLGERLRLQVHADPTRRRSSLHRRDGVLDAVVPESLRESERPAVLARLAASWYRAEAARLLPPLVERLVTATGLRPTRVLIRTQRSRWGSCAADGTIRLSWRLVMLPQEMVEDVVLHELVHLRHRNHGAGFWAALELLRPGAKQRARELRRASRALPEF